MTVALAFTPADRERRRKTLGASEIPAVAGLDKRRSAIDVWAEKTGEAPDPFDGNEYTEWGHRLERVILLKYSEATRQPIIAPALQAVRADEPWMSCTPDALVEHGPGVDAKNRDIRTLDQWGETGTDQVPHDVAAQMHWSMAVTGRREWAVAALFGGNHFRHYLLRFDEQIATDLVALGREFWFSHVLTKVPPPLDGSASAHAFLARRFPTNTDVMRMATEQLTDDAFMLRAVRKRMKELEGEESALEVRIKQAIGEDAGISGPGWSATWKLDRAGRPSWKDIAATFNPPAALIAEHTSAPTRRFLLNVKD